MISVLIAAITSGCAIATVMVVLACLYRCTRKKYVNSRYPSERKDLVLFRDFDIPLTYSNIIAATGNFSLNNLIGTGGFGSTYKAEIVPGRFLAVKRLCVQRFRGTQQFEAEICTLGRMQHPHLVTLIGYHASDSQMFLIFNYLPGGNLESLIHDGGTRFLSWKERLKIAFDTAQALLYLHDECSPRVLHRDIKPSNVLLDNHLNAFLSDFGLARVSTASDTTTTDVFGTYGYVAPEYALSCRLSRKADVYSYGVLLLELLSGKKSLDPSFAIYGHGFTIVAWACEMHEKGFVSMIFAPGLWDTAQHSELCAVLDLAIRCTKVSVSDRPSMRQVVHTLKGLQPAISQSVAGIEVTVKSK